MCETDPGALVKATLLQKSITVQYVAYVRYARTAGAAAEVVKQPEHVRPVALQTRVARGNRLRGASSNPRVVEPEPRISLAGLAEQFVRFNDRGKHRDAMLQSGFAQARLSRQRCRGFRITPCRVG